MKAKRKFWTSEEDKLITTHYPHKLIAELLPLFPDRNQSQIYNRAFFLGLKKTQETIERGREITNKILTEVGEKTRFSKGNKSFNKGMKQSEYMSQEAILKARKTTFKKGNKPHNTREEGDISLRRDTNGIVYAHIKIADANWELMHRYIWRKHNGEIPSGHVVTFINGNTADIRIENLKLITLQENMERNSIHSWPEELKELIYLKKTLTQRINKIEKHGKKQD